MYQEAILPSQCCHVLLRQNRRNMEKNSKFKKYLVRDGIEQLTLQTVPKYAFF